MDIVSLVRLGIAGVATLAFIFFAVRINDDWKSLSRGWHVVRCSLLGIVGVFGFGSIELMFVEPPVPLGVRNGLAVLFLAGVLVGLWLVRKETPPQEGGWIRASDIQRILEDVEDHHSGPCHNPGCIAARIQMREKIAEANHPR